jgi:folate-binding protein YgfZ
MESLKLVLKNSRLKSSVFKIKKHLVYRVVGEDTAEFFSNQITTNSKKHSDMSFHESAIVDPKGRLVCSFLLLRKNKNCFYISFDEVYEEELLARMNLFLISEDVEFIKENFQISVGLNHIDESLYRGSLFGGIECSISFEGIALDEIKEEDLKLLRFTSGKGLMGIHLNPGELITNTFLAKNAIDYDKGCYPGQETISKIHNNKGASIFPVAVIGNVEISENELVLAGKKIGKIKEVIKVNNDVLHYALVNRENQIEGKEIKIDDCSYQIKNFPLIDNSREQIVEDMFDEAVLCFQEGRDEEAKELFRRIIKIDPTYSDAYESLGVILGREKKFEEAIVVMKKLVDVDPTTVMGQTNLSMYYMQLGDKETAEKYKANATLKQFEQFGIEADKKRIIENQEKQMKLEKEQREFMFLQVLDIDPEDALANFGLGELELERNNYDKAIKHLCIAIATDPKYSVAYLALGKSYRSSGDIENTRIVLDKGLSVASKNGDLMPANEMQLILNQL